MSLFFASQITLLLFYLKSVCLIKHNNSSCFLEYKYHLILYSLFVSIHILSERPKEAAGTDSVERTDLIPTKRS